MIRGDRRAEKVCMDALLASPEILGIYGKEKIFQGYAAPNTLGTLDAYILIHRLDSITLDRVAGRVKTDKLRRVRLQVDVSDTDYGDMVSRSELVRDVLETAYQSCVDGDSDGTVSVGQKIFNVCSIDLLLTESEA